MLVVTDTRHSLRSHSSRTSFLDKIMQKVHSSPPYDSFIYNELISNRYYCPHVRKENSLRRRRHRIQNLEMPRPQEITLARTRRSCGTTASSRCTITRSPPKSWCSRLLRPRRPLRTSCTASTTRPRGTCVCYWACRCDLRLFLGVKYDESLSQPSFPS